MCLGCCKRLAPAPTTLTRQTAVQLPSCAVQLLTTSGSVTRPVTTQYSTPFIVSHLIEYSLQEELWEAAAAERGVEGGEDPNPYQVLQSATLGCFQACYWVALELNPSAQLAFGCPGLKAH